MDKKSQKNTADDLLKSKSDISKTQALSDDSKKVLVELLLNDMHDTLCLDKEGKEVLCKNLDKEKKMLVDENDYKKIKKIVIKEVGDPRTADTEDVQNVVESFYKNIQFNNNIEMVEKVPQLEKTNFRIDSNGPDRENREDKYGVTYKINQKKDVIEYLEGKYKGEQFFRREAAIRETKNAGKRMPASWKIFRAIIHKIYKSNYNEIWRGKDFLNGEQIQLCGSYNQSDNEFTYIGDACQLWCEDGSLFSNHRKRGWEWIPFYGPEYKGGRASVRCLKNN